MEDQKQSGAAVGAGAQMEKKEVRSEEQGSVSTPKRKRWTRTNTIVLVIAMVVVWFVGVQIMAAERYPAVVNVVEGVDKVGVNPVARLDFGDLSRDTGANRYVTLKNTGKMAKQIWVVKTGALSEMMKIDTGGSFTLKPGEEVKVEFNVQVPVSAPYQKFTGTVYIFKWPKPF